MNRFNFTVFHKFWAIAKLYWLGAEKKRALGLLVVLGILLVAYTQLSVSLNETQGGLISTLAAQDETAFWETVKEFFLILIIYVPLFAGFSFTQDKLGLFWRKWLTNNFLNRYFSQRHFYQLAVNNKDIDNPDQRISQDISSFTQESLRLLLIVVQSILQVIAFSAVLWSISSQLVIFLIIYALAGTLITTFIYGKKLVSLNFAQLQKEADFRFGLVRVRENAESIAFYQGENQEKNNLTNLFEQVFQNFNALILWQELYLGLFTNTYQFLPYIIPAIVVAPSVLSGDLEVGKVSEATGAFARVFFSLNIIVSRFQSLTNFVAGIDRLSTLSEFLSSSEQEQGLSSSLNKQRYIDTIENNQLAIEHLTLQTPNYQNTLFQSISFQVPTGKGLLVMGASGCGKSSLLRAIAGLWNSGTGAILRPPLGEILFLPQRPYMIIGTLKEQLIYPSFEQNISDSELQQALDLVNLSDLAERFNGFNHEKDWSEVLSLGEQQRVAFARILINKPQYVILDEATSALDSNNEKVLYQHLLQTKATFISVGHSDSLKDYHQYLLFISEDETCELSTI